jgi:P-type E1-E2 ATPase
VSVRQLLEAASIAEARSEHPIGRAILKQAAGQGIVVREPVRFASTPGQGVRVSVDGEEILVGNSGFVTGGRMPERPQDTDAGLMTVFVVRGGCYLGSITLGDLPRSEAKQAMAELRSMKVKTLLLSGDSRAATERVAQDIGVDECEAALLPEAKLARVRQLTLTRRVAMIGDGVNDVPALVAATVGVAMGSGTDVARANADVVLIGNDLLTFVDTLRVSRRTRFVILENFAGTILIDIVGIGLAAAGVLSPVMAAVIHVGSELLFLLNSARLVPRGAAMPNVRANAVH